MRRALRWFVLVIAAGQVLVLTSCAPAGKWQTAAGNIWTGVRIYSGEGEQKTYVGEVLGGTENYTDPVTGASMRGVKLRMASGAEEWKDRSQLGTWGFVDRDDPALKACKWEELRY